MHAPLLQLASKAMGCEKYMLKGPQKAGQQHIL